MEKHLRRMHTIGAHLSCRFAARADLSWPLPAETQSAWHGIHLSRTAGPRHGLPVVVGAMVLDVQATPLDGLRTTGGTTVPGKVRYIHGGVGRNVAECMAMLGAPPLMLSVVGEDAAGEALLAHWRSLGLPTEGIRRCENASTPVVSAVFGAGGEMAAAVADVSALEEHLTPEWVARFSAEIRAAPVILLDGNLLPSVLALVCKWAAEGGVPVWFEPVSVAKSVRATQLLHQITYISPNEAELVAMSEALGGAIQSDRARAAERAPGTEDSRSPSQSHLMRQMQQLQPHIERLLHAGVKHVVLTLGAQGAVLSHRSPPCGCAVLAHPCSSFAGLGREAPSPPGDLRSPCHHAQQLLGQPDSEIDRSSHLGRPLSPFNAPEARGSTNRAGPASGAAAPMSTPRGPCPASHGPAAHWHFPALPARVVNLSGAGDCLVGGTLAALVVGEEVAPGLARGMVAAKLNVECPHNVPKETPPSLVEEDAKKVMASVRLLRL